ncbi:hypothetical protein TNCV_2386611 [Trichonephila clavipes]|nr:hypothetical protein TNCV_2386611 [Trichonephila clavipes]
MREAGWSAQQVARQVGRSELNERRWWDQWTEEMSFTRHMQYLHYGHLCLPKLSQTALLNDIWYRGAYYVCCQCHPPLIPPFGMVSSTTGLDCNGIEPDRLQRRI